MSFPEDLDLDRVLAEALGGVQEASAQWLDGAPTSEEPLMNRLTAQFTRRRRHCDVGVRFPVSMTCRVAFLHRQGDNATDAYGADLALTIDIPERQFRKTVLFQIKVSENFSTRIERRQLQQALADDRTAGRSFLLVADKLRERVRVKSANESLQLIQDGNDSATVDCAEWMPLSRWLWNWFSCDIGPLSDWNDAGSVEKLLQSFVIESPDDWEAPWGETDAAGPLSGQIIPAKAWLEMVFRRVATDQ